MVNLKLYKIFSSISNIFYSPLYQHKALFFSLTTTPQFSLLAFSNTLCKCCLETHSHLITLPPPPPFPHFFSIFGLGVKDLVKRLQYFCTWC